MEVREGDVTAEQRERVRTRCERGSWSETGLKMLTAGLEDGGRGH